jgi:hypothetical protein
MVGTSGIGMARIASILVRMAVVRLGGFPGFGLRHGAVNINRRRVRRFLLLFFPK